MNATISYHKSGIQNLSTGSEKIFFNLETDPWLPCNSWKVFEHRRQGYWKFNSNELSFYTPTKTNRGEYPTGRQLLEKLNAKILLNANCIEEIVNAGLVSEFLSEKERGVKIVFLGTVFKDERDGKDYVRFIFYPEISALRLRYFEETEDLLPPDYLDGVRYWVKALDETFDSSYRIALRKVAIRRPQKSIWKKIAALF